RRRAIRVCPGHRRRRAGDGGTGHRRLRCLPGLRFRADSRPTPFRLDPVLGRGRGGRRGVRPGASTGVAPGMRPQRADHRLSRGPPEEPRQGGGSLMARATIAPGFIAVNTVMVWATFVIAGASLWPIYQSERLVILVAVSLAAG